MKTKHQKSKDLLSTVTPEIKENNIECILTKVLIKCMKLTVIHIYIPPDVDIDKEDLEVLIPEDKYTIILGDTNAKHTTSNISSNNRGTVLYEWILDNDIILLNNKQPAFQLSATGNCSTIDITLVTEELSRKISSWEVGKDLSSDHLPITTTTSLDNTLSPNAPLKQSGK
jgi:exonuclease III